MTTLFIDKGGCDLDLEDGRIVMRESGERAGTWPLALIERVVAHRGARVTGRLMAALSAAGVGLMFDAGRSRAGPATVIPSTVDRGLRLAQYALAVDPARCAAFAAALIHVRIDGAAQLVAGLRPQDPRLGRLADACGRLVSRHHTVAVLRGIEGSAVAAFFEAFSDLVPKPFAFGGRNRRPPRDPVNVCLSLGYSLAQLDAVRAAAIVGLDPSLGFYHEPFPGRASLGCDLVEPVRPRVEAWVLELLASGGIGLGEFTDGDGPCTLSKPGRRFVYRHFEETAADAIRGQLQEGARVLAASLRNGASPLAAVAHTPDV